MKDVIGEDFDIHDEICLGDIEIFL